MNFRLVYNGPLRAASQSETRRLEKHAIRRVFNQQLNTLFAGHYALQEEFGNEGKLGQTLKTMRNFHRGQFIFLPLVREELNLVCDLDILFLRRDEPGKLISGGGDLDNRIKVLFDALRVPQDDNEVRGIDADRDTLCLCVAEDDRLITGFRVTTDRLLEPAISESQEHHVQLIINVEVKATKLTERNLSYFSHF